MPSPAVYTARQLSRVIWYSVQYDLTRRRALPTFTETEQAQTQEADWPEMMEFRRQMVALFRRDWKNIRDGIYPAPRSGLDAAGVSARRSLRYFRDLRHVFLRRRNKRSDEPATSANRARYPRYYLQNFHFQSGGWFGADSADLYDHQVEVLFGGTAEAMRRQGLPPLVQRYRPITRPRPRLLDVATGTGAFLADLRTAIPHARLTGLDFSRDYLCEAARRVPAANLVEAPAEAMPFETGEFDGISAVYLFHELPPRIRRRVAHEIARVLKPGGLCVVVDALQIGDVPVFDSLLDFFPKRFHEPYFSSYIREDLVALFADAGLRCVRSEPVYLSKLFVFEKPASE